MIPAARRLAQQPDAGTGKFEVGDGQVGLCHPLAETRDICVVVRPVVGANGDFHAISFYPAIDVAAKPE
jgi:hypothetical protein